MTWNPIKYELDLTYHAENGRRWTRMETRKEPDMLESVTKDYEKLIENDDLIQTPLDLIKPDT